MYQEEPIERYQTYFSELASELEAEDKANEQMYKPYVRMWIDRKELAGISLLESTDPDPNEVFEASNMEKLHQAFLPSNVDPRTNGLIYYFRIVDRYAKLVSRVKFSQLTIGFHEKDADGNLGPEQFHACHVLNIDYSRMDGLATIFLFVFDKNYHQNGQGINMFKASLYLEPLYIEEQKRKKFQKILESSKVKLKDGNEEFLHSPFMQLIQTHLAEDGEALKDGNITVLWGPPGTGKTERVVFLMANLLKEKPDARILFLALSNNAVLNARLRYEAKTKNSTSRVKKEISSVFFNNEHLEEIRIEQENSSFKEIFDNLLSEVDTSFKDANVNVYVDVTSKDAENFVAETKKKKDIGFNDLIRYLHEHASNQDGLVFEQIRDNKVLDEGSSEVKKGSVVFSSIANAILHLFGNAEAFDKETYLKWDAVVIDEAAMVNPVDVLLLSCLLKQDGQLIMAGDPRQLPPVEEMEVSKANQIFSYLKIRDFAVTSEVPVGLDDGANEGQKSFGGLFCLDTEHRMNKYISHVVSNLSYDGGLKCFDADKGEHIPKKEVALIGKRAISVIDTSTLGPISCKKVKGTFNEKGSPRLLKIDSYYNFLHALVALALANEIVKSYEKDSDRTVGILSPYVPQTELLSILSKKLPLKIRKHIKIKTVHKAQGDTLDTVILDTTFGFTGFTEDRKNRGSEPNRFGMLGGKEDSRSLLNVAISRAQERVIILADFKYIGLDPTKKEACTIVDYDGEKDFVPFLHSIRYENPEGEDGFIYSKDGKYQAQNRRALAKTEDNKVEGIEDFFYQFCAQSNWIDCFENQIYLTKVKGKRWPVLQEKSFGINKTAKDEKGDAGSGMAYKLLRRDMEEAKSIAYFHPSLRDYAVSATRTPSSSDVFFKKLKNLEEDPQKDLDILIFSKLSTHADARLAKFQKYFCSLDRAPSEEFLFIEKNHREKMEEEKPEAEVETMEESAQEGAGQEKKTAKEKTTGNERNRYNLWLGYPLTGKIPRPNTKNGHDRYWEELQEKEAQMKEACCYSLRIKCDKNLYVWVKNVQGIEYNKKGDIGERVKKHYYAIVAVPIANPVKDHTEPFALVLGVGDKGSSTDLLGYLEGDGHEFQETYKSWKKQGRCIYLIGLNLDAVSSNTIKFPAFNYPKEMLEEAFYEEMTSVLAIDNPEEMIEQLEKIENPTGNELQQRILESWRTAERLPYKNQRTLCTSRYGIDKVIERLKNTLSKRVSTKKKSIAVDYTFETADEFLQALGKILYKNELEKIKTEPKPNR